MFNPTVGNVTYDEIAKIIMDFINKDVSANYAIYIGTDSQTYDKTKIVTVIALHKIGNGGKFFYEVSRIKRIMDIRTKLYTETQMSLECAEKLFESLDKIKNQYFFDYKDHIGFSIHVDAGYNGPTKEVIPEIVGWVHSVGLECAVKPYSSAASAIANKYSK